ncbi:hypothetical protein V6N12_036759 [Hibiscus sabdariffa]|uniref:Uncharacterized protein n=1 Tax=Hibiscus sabdariffa TaxID=183260 RepID=A0ABR1ZNJ7_9ROSI
MSNSSDPSATSNLPLVVSPSSWSPNLQLAWPALPSAGVVASLDSGSPKTRAYWLIGMKVLRLPSREQVAIVYGPWMQAPNKKKRVMQSHKAMGDKLVTRGGGHNSRFEVLNVDDVGSDSVVKLFADQLREVVINAGPSPSTKGKMVGVKGVGSSKGADLGGVNHFISVRDSLDALDNHFPNTSP